ncbi:response regulator [bacterium]|nr:response regulator [bacterium]
MSHPGPVTTIREIIAVDTSRCVGCHRCVAVCPVNDCIDASGRHVEVRADRCIGCGACVDACVHEARTTAQDLDAVLAGLAAGEPMVALVAPSAAAAWGEGLGHLLGWLHELGFAACFDVSFGAELCARSYVDFIDRENPTCVIAQPCPVVVNYVERYRPGLIPHLAPIHSPIGHTIAMLREFYPRWRDHRLVTVTPCAAKTRETDALDHATANVTFAELDALIAATGRSLADVPPRPFDGPAAERAVGFSSPGGLLQTIVRDRPELAGQARTIEGPEILPYLDGLAEAIATGDAPRLVDVLNCTAGCNGGTAAGVRRQEHRDRLERPVDARRDAVVAATDRAALDAVIARHWRRDLYRCSYTDRTRTACREVSASELAQTLQWLGKDESDGHLDCGACGYDTCRDMARAIALGLNQPDNCIVVLREKLASNVFESLHTGLMTIDAETHRIERVNPRFCDLVGLSAAEILGRECYEFVCPQSRGRCPVTDLGRDVDATECTMLDSRGREVPIIKSVARITVDGRDKLLENVTSIADRKALEEDLAATATRARALAEAAERASAAKSAFLANMSHEIRTPMNGLLGIVELLQGTPLTTEQQEHLATMRSCGDQLLSLISDVLDISRAEAGRIELASEPFAPREVVASACNVVAATAASKGLDLTTSVAVSVPGRLRGDPGRLRQILVNLLGNAVKFTETGSVSLAVTGTAASEGRTELRVEVRDTGLGIPEDQVAAVFDTFLQVDDSRTRRYEGSGLGLAICRQLVELMGGRIGVTSRVDEGSTFWFTAPLADVSDAAAVESLLGGTAPTPDGDAIPADLRVLVVEDNRINQMVAVRLLDRGLGVTAEAVEDGAAAVEHLREHDVDVVLMDCHMPVMDGYEATRAIRDPATGCRDPQVPIIAMTANAVQGAREECLAAGMDDYITKPVSAPRLRQAIGCALKNVVAS